MSSFAAPDLPRLALLTVLSAAAQLLSDSVACSGNYLIAPSGKLSCCTQHTLPFDVQQLPNIAGMSG